MQGMGWPFIVSLPMAAIVAGITGIMIGLPALRVKGMYLSIATLAFGFILEEVVVRAEHITGGNAGRQLGALTIAGINFDDGTNFYYLVTFIALLCVLGALNLLRSPTGRAFVAIRDSEVSAQSMGICRRPWPALPAHFMRTRSASSRPTSSVSCNPSNC
jgi:branched-chain amino acid transport system permease protein